MLRVSQFIADRTFLFFLCSRCRCIFFLLTALAIHDLAKRKTLQLTIDSRSEWGDLVSNAHVPIDEDQSPQHDSSSRWLESFSKQFEQKLEHFTKRRTTPPKPKGKRTTPKRPRAGHAIVILSDPDSGDGVEVDDSTPQMQRRAQIEEVTTVDIPARKVVVRREESDDEDVHAQELKMQQISKDVDVDELNEFVRFLAKFSQKVEVFKSSAVDLEEANLKVTSNLSYMTEFRQRVAHGAEEGAIRHVRVDLLSAIVSILETRVNHTRQQLTMAAEFSEVSDCFLMDCLLGLVAAHTMLTIIVAPDSPRTLLVEELLDSLIDLVRVVCANVVFPTCDPLYSTKNLSAAQKPGKSIAGKLRAQSTGRNDDLSASATRPSKLTKRVLTREDEALIDACCAVYDVLTALFRKEQHLPDPVVTRCASTCIHSFSVTGIVQLQMQTMRTVNAIFSTYTAHRLSILDEVRERASTVPANRRHLRCFQLLGERSDIRMTSALLAQLLCHASTDTEETTSSGRRGKSSEEDKYAWSNLRRKRFDRAAKLAAHVFDPMLMRIYTDREPEYRTAFYTLFEDILELYGRPEWPAAELMLQTLSVSIITRLRARDDKTAYLRSVSVDVLGSLAAKMCTLYGSEVIQSKTCKNSIQQKFEDLETQREKLLLFLDSSKSLQYAAAYSFYEALFVTDDQNLAFSLRRRAKEIVAEANKMDFEDGEEVLDGQDASFSNDDGINEKVQKCGKLRAQHVMKRRMQREFVERHEAIEAARLVGINRSFAGGFQTIIEAILDGMHDTAPTVRARSIKALSTVDEACHGILRFHPTILKTIEASCRDMSILARDAALELLSRSIVHDASAVKVDTQFATSPYPAASSSPEFFAKIFAIVEKRLSDTATSVRKRAISVMRAVMSDALKHCGPSSSPQEGPGEVDEKAQLHENRIIQICTSLVPRLDDPETTVREASERALRLGLFGFDASQQLRPSFTNLPDTVAMLSERLITVFARLHPSIHTTFMSRVVHKALLIKHKPMLSAMISTTVELLHEYEAKLADANSKERSVQGQSMELRKMSKRRVACASAIAAFAGMDPGLLVPHCRALAPSIKGVLDGSISESDLACVQRILRVLELGLGQSSELDSGFLEEVMHDVEVIVCQSPIPSLEEASVRCLCVVTKKAGTAKASELLMRAASNFMHFLREQRETILNSCLLEHQQKSSALERNARCALIRLGLLTRFGDFDQNFIDEVYDTLQTICSAVCVSNASDILAKASVRALCYLLIRHRALLTKGTQLLLSVMESCKASGLEEGNHFRGIANGISGNRLGAEVMTVAEGVQLCILQGFQELLRDEEERNSSEKKLDFHETSVGSNAKRISTHAKEHCTTGEDTKASEKPHSLEYEVKPVLAAEEDVEAGYLALSAQAMIPELERSVCSPKVHIRIIVANILGLLVRQGLVLPATVVASLFSLLLDESARCREYSLRVISFLADRHPGMLASASLPAFRACFESSFFVRFGFGPLDPWEKKNVHKSHQNGRLILRTVSSWENELVTIEQLLSLSIDDKSGQSLLSPAIMAMRRGQRRGVLESLIREFDPRVAIQNDAQAGNSKGPQAHEEDVDVMNANGTGRGVIQVKLVAQQVEDDVDDDDDDDIGYVSSAEVNISIPDRLCPLSFLYFLAINLASIDYTDGAGVGGSLAQGGGTAIADTKLKYAKEDVSDMVAIATRIISNSGQATLRVAKQLVRKKTQSPEKRRKIALCASRISLLLSLKHHLKVTRWKSMIDVEGDSRDDLDLAAASCRMPEFNLDGTALLIRSQNDEQSTAKDEENVNSVLALFERQMREDAIDDNDVAVPIRRLSKAGPTTRRKNSGRPGGVKRPRRTGGDSIPTFKRERPIRRASMEKSRSRMNFHGESSGGETSEYDPGNIT